MLYQILRLIHIFAGVFWAGAGLMNVAFVSPAVKKAGPEGGKFMQALAQQTKYSLTMDIASTLTLLSGAWLIWIVSGGFQPQWFIMRRGMALTIGSITAVIAYIIAQAIAKPTIARMGQLGQEVAAAGGPPSPEQMAEMGQLQKRMATGGGIAAVLIILSVIGMSLSR